jgi:hypothetical protein
MMCCTATSYLGSVIFGPNRLDFVVLALIVSGDSGLNGGHTADELSVS